MNEEYTGGLLSVAAVPTEQRSPPSRALDSASTISRFSTNVSVGMKYDSNSCLIWETLKDLTSTNSGFGSVSIWSSFVWIDDLLNCLLSSSKGALLKNDLLNKLLLVPSSAAALLLAFLLSLSTNDLPKSFFSCALADDMMRLSLFLSLLFLIVDFLRVDFLRSFFRRLRPLCSPAVISLRIILRSCLTTFLARRTNARRNMNNPMSRAMRPARTMTGKMAQLSIHRK